MRILLVEPYNGGSHRVWAEGYRDASAHDIVIVSHEARWWTWRMRGSAVTLSEAVAAELPEGWQPDAVLVTDMVDVAALRSFLHPIVGRPPLALYMHETQFTYPDSPQMTADLSYPFLNWTSALAADRVVFNSDHHRDVFFEAVPVLLRGFPDHTHVHLVDSVVEKSDVVPVGVDLSWASAQPVRSQVPTVLWNHRWEHDKDPETFADGVRAVADTHDFRLALAGERFRTVPGALDELIEDLADRVVVDRHLPLDEYRDLLLSSSVVVSTALQEFFGIAVVEAIAAGARPVLPAKLSYPWLVPERFHDDVLYPPGGFAAALRAALDDPVSPDGLRAAMRSFDWSVVGPRMDAMVEAL